MTIRRIGWLAALALVVALPAAMADDAARGTAAEAQAMVADAIAYYDQVGADQAFKTFNTSPKPRFYDGDLYIFVISRAGKVIAQAADPGRVGLDANVQLDAAGNPYGRWLVEKPTPEGVWIDYVRTNPSTGKVEAKSSWVVAHDGYNFGCGIYRP
jgi:signal transduction histidine kinase